jgi:hypothetical protein
MKAIEDVPDDMTCEEWNNQNIKAQMIKNPPKLCLCF